MNFIDRIPIAKLSAAILGATLSGGLIAIQPAFASSGNTHLSVFEAFNDGSELTIIGNDFMPGTKVAFGKPDDTPFLFTGSFRGFNDSFRYITISTGAW